MNQNNSENILSDPGNKLPKQRGEIDDTCFIWVNKCNGKLSSIFIYAYIYVNHIFLIYFSSKIYQVMKSFIICLLNILSLYICYSLLSNVFVS